MKRKRTEPSADARLFSSLPSRVRLSGWAVDGEPAAIFKPASGVGRREEDDGRRQIRSDLGDDVPIINPGRHKRRRLRDDAVPTSADEDAAEQ